MIRRIHFVWVVLLICLLVHQKGFCQGESFHALIQRTVQENPTVWKWTKSVAWEQWETQLFIDSRSEAQGYMMDSEYQLFSAASFHLDKGWNRIVFQECLASWIQAVCQRGSDTNQLLWPSKLDVISPCNSQGPDWFYYIYVADASNDRIVRMRYYWPLGSQIMLWDDPITGGGLSLPQDLDINDDSTHYPHEDDYLWVLNAHEIKRFTTDGTLKCTYGTYGCDQAVGHFCRPTAVACGRDAFAYRPYSNNTEIYVADQGNHRLVRLRKHKYFDIVYWIESLALPADARIADLETDIHGHVWAVDRDNGRVYKYTHDLYPLCYYGSFGTGEGQFYYPLNFSNTGGYLGCGNAYVTESWTDNSGGQYFAIGTDVLDFEVTSSVDYRWHYINYMLVDPSDVTIEIYDEQDQLVDTLFDAVELSGACTHVWDGTDQFDQPVGTGAYRVVLTDSSSYKSIETGGAGERGGEGGLAAS